MYIKNMAPKYGRDSFAWRLHFEREKTPMNTLELSCVALGNGGNGSSVCLRT